MRGLLFDLDGTLIDSVPDIAVAVDQSLQAAGFVAAGEDNVRSWVGNGAEQLIRRALAHAQNLLEDAVSAEQTQRVLASFKQAYNDCCCDKSRLYSGVDTALKALQPHYKMAIVTNKPKAFADKIAVSYGLDQSCTVLLGGECMATRKPQPEMLQEAARQLAVPLEHCVMIGDSAADIGAAVNAGISSLAVDYGYHRGADLLALGADALFSDFSSLQHYLIDLTR